MADKSHINPRRKFYIAIQPDNIDGTLDGQNEETTAFATVAEATEYASERISETYCESQFYIYECKPITRIYRAPPRVQKLRS